MPHKLEYVVKDAMMLCDKGSAPVPFSPTYNTHVKMKGCLVATKVDKQPNVNIPPFGSCSARSGYACTPIPTDWEDTYKVKVKGEQTLLYKSKMPCATGGKIEFITSGQVAIPPEEYDKLMEEYGEEVDEGWGFWDYVELLPVVGSAVGVVRETAKGNWGMAAMNVGFLAMDIAGLVTLGATTAASTVAKAGIKATIKATAKSTAKGIAKLGTKQGVKQLAKGAAKGFSKALAKKVDEIAKVAGVVCVYACFPAGTKVAVKNGYKNIEDIQKGDLVWAYNEQTEESELKSVLNTQENEVDATLKITLEGEVIETTAEHPFYTQSGWKDAADLTENDSVKTQEGNWYRVEATNFLHSQKKVYNFEVESHHNYFVGSLKWLVHNAKVCLSQLAKAGVKYAKNILNGQKFDKAMAKAYDYTQIKLKNGKILDVLIPGKELISHKYTQLSEINYKTAKSYIDEIGKKYANQGTKSRKLTEQKNTIDLKHILEIPPQKNGIPKEVLDYADKLNIEIREISGKALEEFNKMNFY